MPRKKKIVIVPLDAIWEIPDEAWERLEPILLQRYPPKSTGRKRIDRRIREKAEDAARLARRPG